MTLSPDIAKLDEKALEQAISGNKPYSDFFERNKKRLRTFVAYYESCKAAPRPEEDEEIDDDALPSIEDVKGILKPDPRQSSEYQRGWNARAALRGISDISATENDKSIGCEEAGRTGARPAGAARTAAYIDRPERPKGWQGDERRCRGCRLPNPDDVYASYWSALFIDYLKYRKFKRDFKAEKYGEDPCVGGGTGWD